MCEFEAEFYDSRSTVQYELGLRTIDLLHIQNGEKILDIGCGTGRLTLEIARGNPEGTIIGLDNNQSMIAKAIENLKKSKLRNIQFIRENIIQYKPIIQFDAIFSNSALHWIQDTHALYQKLYDILVTDGRLIAQMPTKGSLDRFISTFMMPIQSLNLSDYFRNWTYPIKLISLNAHQRILSSIGFEKVNLWVEDQNIQFKTPIDLLEFLKSAALVPILSQIPVERRELYLTALLELLKSNGKLELSVTMKRLFLDVKKGTK
jgi:trans-aconitate methyltransferase